MITSNHRQNMNPFSSLFNTDPKVKYYGLGLFAGLFVIYLLVGLQFSTTSAFQYFDVLFELDTPRVVEDMAVFDGDHHRTAVHPIYVILVNPLGTVLTYLFKSPYTSAVIINALLGALGVTLGFFLFWTYSLDKTNALLLSLFFALTASQFILSVVPETSSFAIVSLILTYLLFLHGLMTRQVLFRWWILAGLLTLGITITNFVQCVICFFILNWMLSEKKESLFHPIRSRVVHLGLNVAGVAVVLATIQKIIYPSASLFFNPFAFREDKGYINLQMIFEQPLTVITQELKSFFIVDFIPPVPDAFFIPSIDTSAVTFSLSWDYPWIGWAAIALWLFLLIFSVSRIFRDKALQPFFFGLALCLLFNLGLHSIYGIGEDDIYGTLIPGRLEFFMFSGNFHFLILAFLSPLLTMKEWWVRPALILLLGLTALNNIPVFRFIFEAIS